MRGRLELADLLTRRAALMEGRIAPSAALQVVANMGVNAHVTRTGLRTVSTLHSSTYLDGKVRRRPRPPRGMGWTRYTLHPSGPQFNPVLTAGRCEWRAPSWWRCR